VTYKIFAADTLRDDVTLTTDSFTLNVCNHSRQLVVTTLLIDGSVCNVSTMT